MYFNAIHTPCCGLFFEQKNKEINLELTIKPGSVVDSHSSGTGVATCLKQPTRERCGPHLCFSHCSPIWSCSRWGLPCRYCYQQRGALLPHPFTLTESYSEHDKAVYFLLHWPWDCSPQALPGTLPYGARTFLPFNTSIETATASVNSGIHYPRIIFRKLLIF